MHHSYLDKYARQDSLLHRLDSRTKLLLFISPVILTAIIPHPGTLFIMALVSAILILFHLAGVPITYLLSRSLIIIPFAGFAVLSYTLTISQGDVYWEWGPFMLTSDGAERGFHLLARSWIAVSFMILLINTVPFNRLLDALKFFRIPGILILLLSFFYRYLYLLWDEAERMQRARNIRYFGGFWRRQAGLLGNIVTTLFIRSYERAERVQVSMQSRGWYGQIPGYARTPFALTDKFSLLLGIIIIVILWLIRNL